MKFYHQPWTSTVKQWSVLDYKTSQIQRKKERKKNHKEQACNHGAVLSAKQKMNSPLRSYCHPKRIFETDVVRLVSSSNSEWFSIHRTYFTLYFYHAQELLLSCIGLVGTHLIDRGRFYMEEVLLNISNRQRSLWFDNPYSHVLKPQDLIDLYCTWYFCN